MLVGWITGRLYVVVLGLLLLVPGLLLLALDQLNGGHPAPHLPPEDDEDEVIDDDETDEPDDLFDDGRPVRSYDPGPSGSTRGATRLSTDDDPTEVYQPRTR